MASDPVLGERASARFGREMDLWLGVETHLERTETGVRLRAGDREAQVDLLLAALGRRPAHHGLNLQDAGFPLDARGTPRFDPATMQVGELPVFIAGDANARPPPESTKHPMKAPSPATTPHATPQLALRARSRWA